MPFDFKAYDAKCAGMTPLELQKEWEHYTRLIAGGATSTAISGLAIPLTAGISTIGVALAAPGLHNSRRKREIIERHLQRHGTTHETRKRDVLGSMAFSGTVGVVTLGVGSAGADSIMQNGAEHGLVLCDTAVKAVTHAALDGVGMGLEHAHTSHKKKKDAHIAFEKAGVFQAVANAKEQEAGYSIDQQQQMQQQYYAAGTSAIAGSPSMVMPPPRYTPYDPLQPVSAPPPGMALGSAYAAAGEKQPEQFAKQVHDPYQQYYQTEASVASGVPVHQGPAQSVFIEQTLHAQQTRQQDYSAAPPAVNMQTQHMYSSQTSQTTTRSPVTEVHELPNNLKPPVQSAPAATQPPGVSPSPAPVFEMAALEKALPQSVTTTTAGSTTAPPSTISTVSTPQTVYSKVTRSSTMVSDCSTAYQVEPGCCPSPQPEQTYLPPPPPPAPSQGTTMQQHTVATTTSQATSQSTIASSQLGTNQQYPPQYQCYSLSTTAVVAPSSPTSLGPSTPHYQPAPFPSAYNPAAPTLQQPYTPSPMATPAVASIPQQQAPMYFAPPPEQAAASGAKSKRMSMMSMATNKLASGLSTAADALENYAQKQPQQKQPQATAYNPAEVAHPRPQPTPQQHTYNYNTVQSQLQVSTEQHTQYSGYQIMTTALTGQQQFPPTPISPPFSPPNVQSQQQYQPQPAQQLQPQHTGYFPPPPPPPQQHQTHQYPPQKIPEAYNSSSSSYAYPQIGNGAAGGHGVALTPMASPYGA